MLRLRGKLCKFHMSVAHENIQMLICTLEMKMVTWKRVYEQRSSRE